MAWDNRGTELPEVVASTLIRSLDSGASDSRAMIRYSKWLMPKLALQLSAQQRLQPQDHRRQLLPNTLLGGV